MTWIAVFAVLAVCLLSIRSKELYALTAFASAFIVLLLLLGLFRVPYRLGWGDSANSILTHLLPVLLFGLTLIAQRVRSEGVLSLIAAPGIRTQARAFSSVALISTILILPVLLWNLGPKDLAPLSTVRDAPPFCPDDRWGRYDFGMALDRSNQSGYVAACTSGPVTITIELPHAARIASLVFDELSADQQWTDFALEVSNDSQIWRSFYDTRDTGNSPASLVRDGPIQFSVLLNQSLAGNFIRIHFRASKGENRLLLRQLSIIASRSLATGDYSRVEAAIDVPHGKILDLAPASIVRSSEGFCPNDQWGEYGFDMALAPGQRSGYAASCRAGTSEVTIEVPDAQNVRWFELLEYSRSESWLDFALLSSSDQQNWDVLFDTATKSKNVFLHRFEPGKLRLNLVRPATFRYLRLVHRTSAGQNRLLLRRLAIYAEAVPSERKVDLISLINKSLGERPSSCKEGESLLQVISTKHTNDYGKVENVSFNSCGSVIPAYLATPTSVTSTTPIVLGLPQTSIYGKDEIMGFAGDPHLAFGALLFKAGFVVLVPDEFPQAYKTPDQVNFSTREFYRQFPNWSAMGAMLEHHKSAVTALTNYQPSECLAVVGHSLGGHNALFLTAMDRRVDVTVASGAFEMISTDARATRWTREGIFNYLPSLHTYLATPAPRWVPFDFDDLLKSFRNKETLLIQGENDPTWTWPSSINYAMARLDADHRRAYVPSVRLILHSSQHQFPPEAQRATVDFLKAACHQK